MAYLSLATGSKRETVLKLEVMRCTCPFIPTKSKKDSHSVVGLSFAFHELVTENVPNIQQKMNLWYKDNFNMPRPENEARQNLPADYL